MVERSCGLKAERTPCESPLEFVEESEIVLDRRERRLFLRQPMSLLSHDGAVKAKKDARSARITS